MTEDFSHGHTERHHQDKPGLTYYSSSSVHVSLTLLIPQKKHFGSLVKNLNQSETTTSSLFSTFPFKLGYKVEAKRRSGNIVAFGFRISYSELLGKGHPLLLQSESVRVVTTTDYLTNNSNPICIYSNLINLQTFSWFVAQ